METVHAGMTVLCLYPTPNSRKLPSVSYIKDGLTKCIDENNVRKIIIANSVLCCNIRVLINILYSYKIFLHFVVLYNILVRSSDHKLSVD